MFQNVCFENCIVYFLVFVLLMTFVGGGLLLLISHVLNTRISPGELQFITPGYVIDKGKKVTFHILPKEPKL